MAYQSYVRDKISHLSGIESAEIGKMGEINVVIGAGVNRELRQEVLDIGSNSMLAVRVFYRMPDGRVIGESQLEGIEDYYKPVHVPGFLGEPVEAPPEEVAAEPKGALKLRRIRSKTRGRPVVGWKLGDREIRRGTDVKFKSATALQWTMGRTLNVKPGATAKVTGLATSQPMMYLNIGGYEGVECPIHAVDHVFDIESKAKGKKESIDSSIGYRMPELMRLINTVGMGSIEPPDSEEYEETYEEPSGDMLAPPDAAGVGPKDQRFKGKPARSSQRVALFGRK